MRGIVLAANKHHKFNKGARLFLDPIPYTPNPIPHLNGVKTYGPSKVVGTDRLE